MFATRPDLVQFRDGGICLIRAARVLRAASTSRSFFGNCRGSSGASATCAHLIGLAVCCSIATAIVLDISLISLVALVMSAIPATLARVLLDGVMRSVTSSVPSRSLLPAPSLRWQQLRTFAGFSCACRFDGGIQSKQVGLLRDALMTLMTLRSEPKTHPGC